MVAANENGKDWCSYTSTVVLWKVAELPVLDRHRHDCEVSGIAYGLKVTAND